MKYALTEMKNTLEGINSRLNDAEERISKLKDSHRNHYYRKEKRKNYEKK